MINVKKLNEELKAAGIQFAAVNSNGVVHGMDGMTEIQDRPDVAAVIAAHDPTETQQVEVVFELPLRPGLSPTMTSPASLSIEIYEGSVWTGTEFIFVETQNVDLSAQLPATPGDAALVLVTVDDSGDIIQTKGSETTLALLCPDGDEFANAPSIPSGTVEAIALIRMYEGQTEIREGRATLDGTNRAFTDFIDVRGTYRPTTTAGGDAVFQRNLTADLTLADGQCLTVVRYIDLNGHALELVGDAALEIL